MFWRFSYSTSQLQTLLEKPDVTLLEVVEEDDVLQECKSNNEKLINFLTRYDNMKTLVHNIVNLPPEELDERIRFKQSTISCELLTCDITMINDALINNIEFLDTIFSFLKNSAPLNPLLASYFAKVVGSLISRKTEPFLNYLQSKEDFVSLFLKHINTSAIMDVFLRLLTTIDNAELRNKVLDWLKQINIIENLIELLSSEYSSQIHSNVSQVLCDIIHISREQILSSMDASSNALNLSDSKSSDSESQKGDEETKLACTNTLLSSIEKQENIQRLLELTLGSIGQTSCSLTSGIEVLLTILDYKTTIPDLSENQLSESVQNRKRTEFNMSIKGIKSVMNCCIERLSEIHKNLIELESKSKTLTSTDGTQFALFGNERLYLVKLIARLISFDHYELNASLIQLNTINVLIILGIFSILFVAEISFPIELNETSVEAPQKDAKELLIRHILTDCHLVEKILEAWNLYFVSRTTKETSKMKQSQSGYIGHLNQITNILWNSCKEGKYSALIQAYFNENATICEKWKSTYEQNITEMNKKLARDLVRNPLASISAEPNGDGQISEVAINENISKKYAEFHREMKINCVDNFSLSENHVISYQPKYPDLFNKLQNISFQMDSNDETANLFEQVCSQRDNMCLSSEQSNIMIDEEIWVSKEIKFADNFNSFSSGSKTKENEMDITEPDQSQRSVENSKENLDENSKNLSPSVLSTGSSSEDEDDEKKVPPEEDEFMKHNVVKEANDNANDDWADFEKLSSPAAAVASLSNENNAFISDPWNSVVAEASSNSNSNSHDENWANFGN